MSGVPNAMPGAYLVCLEVPKGIEFGVDYESFQTGEKFKGVKCIPSGLHFVFYSNGQDSHGIRQGFFVNLKEQDVYIRKWNEEDEQLDAPDASITASNLADAVRAYHLDQYLGLYPQKHFKTWKKLTHLITDSVLKRCQITYGATLIPGDPDVQDIGQDSAENPIVNYHSNSPRIIQFTSMKRKENRDLSPAELTKYHMDSSALLEEIVAEKFGGSFMEFLGELQLAFISFLLLSSLQGLEQWKKMLWMLCTSEEVATERNDAYSLLLRIIHAQLAQVPSDFFQDELSKDNFLTSCLSSLFEILDVDEQEMNEKLRKDALKLQQFFQKKFGRQFKMAGTYAFADDEASAVLVTPDELPSFVFSADPNDCENFNLQVATQTKEQFSSNDIQ